NVAVEHHEIRQHTGAEGAFIVFREFGVGGAGGVGGNSLVNRDLLLRKVFLGASFVPAGNGGIETAEGRDGLDGIVGAEGQRDIVLQELCPGVGGARALRADAFHSPVHVGEQVVGLHGGDHAQLVEAGELLGRDHLRMLDAEAEAAGANV